MTTSAQPTGFDAVEVTNQVVNEWVQQNFGLPITISLNRLGFAVAEALEAAWRAGFESGWKGCEDARHEPG